MLTSVCVYNRLRVDGPEFLRCYFFFFFIFSDIISTKESRGFHRSRSNIHSGQTWGSCAIPAKVVVTFCRREAKNKKRGNRSYRPRDEKIVDNCKYS